MIDLELPYLSEDLKGIGGKIKKKPGDFIVREIPMYEPQGKGVHLYLNMTKKGLTTKEVENRLGSLFDLDSVDIGSAGMKDKNAVATQTISLNLQNKEYGRDKVVEDFKENFGKDLKLNWAKFHKNKLRTGHSLGNEFEIVIKDLDLDKEEALNRVERIASLLKERGVPNFYGKQRFGKEGENPEKGLKIIKGKKEVHKHWLRSLLISSYQSHLFNLYLKARIEEGLFDELLLGDIAKKHDTGGMFEVKDVKREQERYEDKEISFTGPIFGEDMWKTKQDSWKFEKGILEEAEVTFNELKQAGVGGTRRYGRLLVGDLKYSWLRGDIKLEFSLFKGGYATVVLREFMKNF